MSSCFKNNINTLYVIRYNNPDIRKSFLPNRTFQASVCLLAKSGGHTRIWLGPNLVTPAKFAMLPNLRGRKKGAGLSPDPRFGRMPELLLADLRDARLRVEVHAALGARLGNSPMLPDHRADLGPVRLGNRANRTGEPCDLASRNRAQSLDQFGIIHSLPATRGNSHFILGDKLISILRRFGRHLPLHSYCQHLVGTGTVPVPRAYHRAEPQPGIPISNLAATRRLIWYHSESHAYSIPNLICCQIGRAYQILASAKFDNARQICEAAKFASLPNLRTQQMGAGRTRPPIC